MTADLCCHTWNPVQTLTYLCTSCLRITEIKNNENTVVFTCSAQELSDSTLVRWHKTDVLRWCYRRWTLLPPPRTRGSVSRAWYKVTVAEESLCFVFRGDCGDVPHKWLPGGWLYVATQTRPVLCIFLMLQQTFCTCVSGICCLVFA